VDTYFEADIAATCAGNEVGRQAIKDPFLIVEILSPSTDVVIVGSSCPATGRSRQWKKSC